MAPRKRPGRGFSDIFCCFKGSDHPEITYRLRHDSNFTLQTMAPSLPMPPEEELDAMFSELVVRTVPGLGLAHCHADMLTLALCLSLCLFFCCLSLCLSLLCLSSPIQSCWLVLGSARHYK